MHLLYEWFYPELGKVKLKINVFKAHSVEFFQRLTLLKRIALNFLKSYFVKALKRFVKTFIAAGSAKLLPLKGTGMENIM